jgi:serine/threonine protein kinase
VLDYGGEDLGFQFDTRGAVLTESQIKEIMKQLLRGVACLHFQGILHRDLKLSNILVDSNGRLRICDFGLARTYDQCMTSGVATLWYRAPELLLRCKDYTTAIDMWSIGCIFAELLNKGKPVFPGKSEANQFQLICKLIGAPNATIWPDYSRFSSRFQVPESPYNTLNVFFNDYSQECIDFLNSLLVWDPCKRLSAAEALLSSYLL